jgi:hypothetical protein
MKIWAEGVRVVVGLAVTGLFAAPVPKAPPQPVLTCELKVESEPGAEAKGVRFTMSVTNRTKEPIEIAWTLHPSQYFDLTVSDLGENRVKTMPY